MYVVTISRDTFNDWSIGATLRKIICLLALLAGFAAMMPEHLVSQIGYHAAETPDQVRLTDLERRTSSLEALPERQAMVEAALKDLKEEVDSLNTRAWLILCAALAALLDRFLGVFGIRVRGGAA